MSARSGTLPYCTLRSKEARLVLFSTTTCSARLFSECGGLFCYLWTTGLGKIKESGWQRTFLAWSYYFFLWFSSFPALTASLSSSTTSSTSSSSINSCYKMSSREFISSGWVVRVCCYSSNGDCEAKKGLDVPATAMLLIISSSSYSFSLMYNGEPKLLHLP